MRKKSPPEYTDSERLDWLLSQFYTDNNNWSIEFSLRVDKNGIRAAIDNEITVRKEIDEGSIS